MPTVRLPGSSRAKGLLPTWGTPAGDSNNYFDKRNQTKEINYVDSGMDCVGLVAGFIGSKLVNKDGRGRHP